jgi:hypothetical protein
VTEEMQVSSGTRAKAFHRFNPQSLRGTKHGNSRSLPSTLKTQHSTPCIPRTPQRLTPEGQTYQVSLRRKTKIKITVTRWITLISTPWIIEREHENEIQDNWVIRWTIGLSAPHRYAQTTSAAQPSAEVPLELA